ncbi:MAG: ABC transporter substrate-binding protein, partial [Acidimicrobiales bacterium]
LYAIGAGSQVVGVDKFSTYPPNAPRTSFTGNESSAEDYLPERPDLVVLFNDANNLVGQLNKLHIPVLVAPAATTIGQADRQIVELGAATGHEANARREVSAVDSDLDRVVGSVDGRGHGATYYVELDQTYYSATSKTFIGALFNRFGMVNIADPAGHGSDYPQLSAEYVLKASPDYVFLADTICCAQSAETFAARPGFSNLKAVDLGHVIGVNDSVASEWGPHSLEAMVKVIAQALTTRHAAGSGGA